MSALADQLAEQFEAANEAVITVAAQCSDEQWHATRAVDGWTIGITLHHVADDYPDLLEVIEAIATGTPIPQVTRELLDERNAQHAQRCARCTREETIALLRRNGAAVIDSIRGLGDEQLGRTGHLLGREMSVTQVLELMLLGHVRTHLADVRTAL